MVEKESSLAAQLFSESATALGIVVGVLLIWVASLVSVLTTGVDAMKVVSILRYTGVAMVSVMLIGRGVTVSEKEKSVRIAMVVMGAIILLVLIGGVSVLI